MDDVSLDAAIWRLLDHFELDPSKESICYVTVAVHQSGDTTLCAVRLEGATQRVEGTLSNRVEHQLVLGDGWFAPCHCLRGEDHPEPS